jgi:hypothetical protein
MFEVVPDRTFDEEHMMRRISAVVLLITAAMVMGVSLSAAPPVKDGAPLSYNCRFARGAWTADDWIMVKSPRWSHVGKWVQNGDHILNATPADATDKDLAGSRATETYTSMVLKQKVGGTTTITSTMSFDDRMAPLIVLADTLGADDQGHAEYRNHTEIVVYSGGINIWQHYYRDGKPSWVKLAWDDFELKPRTKYEMKVTVNDKQIQVSAGGHTLGCTNPDLPDLYHVGITGCEGKNRFYDFKVDAAR